MGFVRRKRVPECKSDRISFRPRDSRRGLMDVEDVRIRVYEVHKCEKTDEAYGTMSNWPHPPLPGSFEHTAIRRRLTTDD